MERYALLRQMEVQAAQMLHVRHIFVDVLSATVSKEYVGILLLSLPVLLPWSKIYGRKCTNLSYSFSFSSFFSSFSEYV